MKRYREAIENLKEETSRARDDAMMARVEHKRVQGEVERLKQRMSMEAQGMQAAAEAAGRGLPRILDEGVELYDMWRVPGPEDELNEVGHQIQVPDGLMGGWWQACKAECAARGGGAGLGGPPTREPGLPAASGQRPGASAAVLGQGHGRDRNRGGAGRRAEARQGEVREGAVD